MSQEDLEKEESIRLWEELEYKEEVRGRFLCKIKLIKEYTSLADEFEALAKDLRRDAAIVARSAILDADVMK